MRHLILAALLASTALVAADTKLEATLQHTPSAAGDAMIGLTLTLTNRGEKALALITPGDGSDVGWRTPVLTFTWLQNGKPVPKGDFARCGNMNALRPEELFTLKPGESKTFGEWVSTLPPALGDYQLKVTYTNTPNHPWRGEPTLNAALLEKVRATDAVSAESNTIDVSAVTPFETRATILARRARENPEAPKSDTPPTK